MLTHNRIHVAVPGRPTASPTLAIYERMQEQVRQGKNVYRLGFGGSPLPPPQILIETYRKNLERTEYPPIRGHEALRENIAQYYGSKHRSHFDPQRIFIFPGSKDALFHMLKVIDGIVLLPSASWVSYEPQARFLKKRLEWIRTSRANDYKLDPSDLEECAAKLPAKEHKILILNSPSNPTGFVYKNHELKKIAEVCRKYGIIVLFDAIYAHETDFDGQSTALMSELYPEGTIVTGGISKIFSAGGWRLGFAALPQGQLWEDVSAALVSLMSETISGVNYPLQIASAEAFSGSEDLDCYLARCKKVYKMAGRYLWTHLNRIGIDCPKPEGAFYVFPNFTKFRGEINAKGIFTSEQLGERLQENQIFALPGEAFGVDGTELCFRFANVDFDGKKVITAIDSHQDDDSFVEENMPQIAGAVKSLENLISQGFTS